MHTLKGKVIIVVGATGGIGSVLSQVFLEHGAEVVLASRTKENLLELQKTLGAERTLVVPTDATITESVQNLFEETKQAFGHVDAIVNTTGTWKQLSIYETPGAAAELVKNHFQVFFMTSFNVGYIGQDFFRIQDNGSGLIINISSHAAIKPELHGNLTYGPMKS
ncbi:SDR family oxidoreductase, partial [Patescibacteria group bacterium]|nr:SDR family oxidoreductase [Patescibacteria group bacterium]